MEQQQQQQQQQIYQQSASVQEEKDEGDIETAAAPIAASEPAEDAPPEPPMEVELAEVGAKREEEGTKISSLPLLEDVAPGVEKMTRWWAQKPFSSEEGGLAASHISAVIPFSGVASSLTTTTVSTEIAADNTEDAGTDQEHDHQTVEAFLGVDPHLQKQLRQRRRHHQEHHNVYDTRRYTTPDSPLWHHTTHTLNLHDQQRRVARTGLLLKGCIALGMSVIGFAIAQCAENLLQWKIDAVVEYLQNGEDSSTVRGVLAFIFWLTVNLALGLCATLPVLLWKPSSAGSGIAEAKAVLNGIDLPECTQLTSALCKAVSVVCSSAASLPVGLEGPMIFIGLALGDHVVEILPPSPAATVYKMDRHKRDLQAIGTACGVTSAFSSPIGGVLFAMEEGCSYWSYDLAWRSFTAACVTAILNYCWVFIFDLARERHRFGDFLSYQDVSKFEGIPGDAPTEADTDHAWISFRMRDYVAFAGMGIVGGIVGACWCEINRSLALQRAKWHAGSNNKLTRLLEVLVLVATTSTVLWWLPQIYAVCSPIDVVPEYYQTVGCSEGDYNELATLFWNPTSTIGINLLFWESPKAFSIASCLLVGSVVLILLLVLFGSAIGMGIFIPLLFAGACFGRAFALASGGTHLVTSYAMVGSVSMLAGVTRVFISLCVIMITSTGQPHLISPFMVATILARGVGRAIFGREGIYDIILDLKAIPFLEESPSPHIMYRGLKAKDIMSPLPFTLKPEETVSNLLHGLKMSDDLHDIPIVDSSRDSVLLGTLSRSHLLTILSQPQLFYDKGQNHHKALSHESLHQQLANRLTLECVQDELTEDDWHRNVDLSPYIRTAPCSLHLLASAERSYSLFRTLGLRNLIITDLSGRPVGTVTRNDLHMLEDDWTNNNQHEAESMMNSDGRPLTDSYSFMS